MSDSSITVTLDKRLGTVFAAVGAAVGFGCAFAVGPVVGWLLDTVDGAPAPLRLLHQLPLGWAVVVLTVAGLVAGLIVFGIWGDEVGEVRIGPDEVVVSDGKRRVTYTRDEIAELFLDKDELVLLDAQSRELSRTASDSGLGARLGEAFGRFDYPWSGQGDPRDAQFTTWVDRSRDLDPAAHDALRRRERALTDGRTGAAAESREELLRMGIVVRDRSDGQQYRTVDDRT